MPGAGKYDLSLSDRSLNPTRFGSRPEHGIFSRSCFAAESLSKAFARQKATYAFELDGGGGGCGDGKRPFEGG